MNPFNPDAQRNDSPDDDDDEEEHGRGRVRHHRGDYDDGDYDDDDDDEVGDYDDDDDDDDHYADEEDEDYGDEDGDVGYDDSDRAGGDGGDEYDDDDEEYLHDGFDDEGIEDDEDDDENEDGESMSDEDQMLSRRSHYIPNVLAQGFDVDDVHGDHENLHDGVGHTAGWQPEEVDFDEHTHVVEVRRHSNITGGGRVYSYSAIAIVGDGNGMSGWSYARGNTAPLAIERARKQAEQKQVAIDRFRGGLAEDAYGVCGKTKVHIRALQPDALIKGPPLLRAIFTSFGLNAVAGKFYGPSNTRRRMIATYQALMSTVHPEMMARRTGQVWFDTKKIWRKGDRVWSYD